MGSTAGCTCWTGEVTPSRLTRTGSRVGTGATANGGDDDEADFHPVIFVGPNCSLTIKNAVIETSSSRGGGPARRRDRGVALWPRLVRLAPGGRISASSRDKVSFASSSGAAVAPSDVDGHGQTTLVDGSQELRERGGLKPGDRSSLSIRVVGVSLRLIGETRGGRTRRDRPRLWPRSLRSRRGIGRRRETRRERRRYGR